MRTKFVFLGVILAVGFSVSACDIKAGADGGGFSLGLATGQASDNWTRTYTVPAGGRLELINVNGRIDAEPASGAAIEVSAQRTAKATTDEAAKEVLKSIEMREEVGDQRVRVEVRPPRLSGMSGHEFKWTIKVPKGVHVDLRTVNGGVRVTGLTGEVRLKTTNGGVTGKDIAATLIDASAVNGGVDIELGAPLGGDEQIELQTVNGGASLGLTADSKATLSGRAVNGGVRADDGLGITRTSEEDSRRRLEGTMNGGGARVNVHTVNGGVRFEMSGSRKGT
ncbi:MAG: hypothetical protein ABI665_21265 [Vicinamibacterales bacterium]